MNELVAKDVQLDIPTQLVRKDGKEASKAPVAEVTEAPKPTAG